MPVKKKVTSSIDSFIEKGAQVKASKDRSFKNVLIRMPTGILDELDSWVEKKPWINRTQWIVEAIHERLKIQFEDEKIRLQMTLEDFKEI
jgi:hypothetical protein